MALIKKVLTDFGIDGEYWRIIAIESYFGEPRRATVIHLAQYVNKASRNKGGRPLQIKRVMFDGETNGFRPEEPEFSKNPDFLPDPTQADAYTALKQTSSFLDAVDD